jgi:hypothetical protein
MFHRSTRYRSRERAPNCAMLIMSKHRWNCDHLWPTTAWVMFIWLALLLPSSPAMLFPQATSSAQTPSSGSVQGHVHGPGYTAVPGAKVLLINTQSGAQKETWTNTAGDYVLTGIDPGTYRLVVSLAGFQNDVREPVPITAAKGLRVNVALVFATAANSTAGSRGGGQLSGGLPNLQAMNRGGAMPGGGQGGSGGGGASLRFDSGAAGAGGDMGGDAGMGDTASSSSNSFLLAGNTVNAPTPGDRRAEMRQRFQQFRNSMSAQGAPGFGGGGSRFDNAMIFFGGMNRFRPRVNRLRGNFYARYSNASLDARPYPLNIAQSPQIPQHVEQLGVSLGGPLVIPKIYNGGDKTSFFVHYNRQRNLSPFDSFSTVPTVAERAGDFSQALIPSGPFAGTVPVIYNPASGASGSRTPFAGNVIPASMMNPAAVGLLGYIPLPNQPGSVQNFYLQDSLPSYNDRIMARMGHQATPKDSINLFYFFNSARSQSVSTYPELTQSLSVRSQNVNLSETHTLSSRVINILTVNFNRQRTLTLDPFAFTQNIAGDLGIKGISQNPMDYGLPLINFTNFGALNDVIPSLVRNQTFRVFELLVINSGNHNFRAGGEVRRVELNDLTNPDARGTFTFSGYSTSNFTASGAPVANTGFDFADFLLGLPQNTSVRFGTSSNYFRSSVFSGFGQDDWRFSPHLTFDLGLRYEYFTPFVEKYGHLSDLAFGPGFSSASVVTGQNPGNLPASLIHGDPNDWAPRAGLAYRPWSNHSLVIRAGYGIFYDNSIYQRLVPNLANQPPFAQASTLVTSPTQVLTLQNGFPAIGPNILTNTYAVDPNFITPRAQTWNFSLEQQLVTDLILNIGYVGTEGSNLDLRLAPNSASTGSTGTGQSNLRLANALPFEYETSGASSIYNALQVGLRRQFHNGLSFDVNYTYSNAIDDAASVGGSGSFVAQNAYDLAAERGLSSFNRTHRLVIDHNYELPWGDRRRYLNHDGTLAHIFGNWQYSGVATLESGTPYTALILGNVSNNVGGAAPFASLRANVTGAPVTLPASQQSTLEYFNTAAFTLPAPGEYGDAARNTIPGPPVYSFDMSLDKFLTFSREKGWNGDLRIESDNIFNTPSFDGLATVVNASNFGRVTSVMPMRNIFLTLRMRF